jgi:hypothetical protein
LLDFNHYVQGIDVTHKLRMSTSLNVAAAAGAAAAGVAPPAVSVMAAAADAVADDITIELDLEAIS